MRRRLEPFADLLDARYLPLLLVVVPQAYTVYAWLVRDGAPWGVALIGGVGFETVYVGAVTWAERGSGWSTARVPAIAALLFSVAVAVAYYAPTQGALGVLHAGFAVVGFAYTQAMHLAQPQRAREARQEPRSGTIAPEARPAPTPLTITPLDPAQVAERKRSTANDWTCPSCRRMLANRQAYQSAVKNRYCKVCKPRTVASAGRSAR